MACKVLICDDSDADVSLLLHSFTSAGLDFQLMRARDGDEALEFLTSGPKVDLVVLDQRLPRRLGQDIIEELQRRGKFPRCPVVLFTSSVERKHYELSAQGVHTILEKPFSLDGYLEVAHSLAKLCTDSAQ